MTRTLGWLLGLENTVAIDEIKPSLAAAWAQDGPFWVFLGAVALLIAAQVFYWKYQHRGSPALRVALATCRGLLLAVLLITLADPVLQLTVTSEQKPLLYVIVDGTDSMAIEDELTDADRQTIDAAVEAQNLTPEEKPKSRMAYIQALLKKRNANLLVELQKQGNFEIEAFLFDGNTTSQLKKLSLNPQGTSEIDPEFLAAQLSTTGKVTAVGSVMTELSQQFGSSRLAGVVILSDFANNSGPSPIGSADQSLAARLGVPVYAVGLGVTEAVDLAVDLQTDPKMKKAERSTVMVKLRQSGLTGQTVSVSVMARKLSGEASSEMAESIKVGDRTVTLTAGVETVELPFTPDESGRFEFTATVDPVEGELIDQNNRATRQVNIIDDYLRLMYVANEPTWEWRFIKEVFHRDKLVGMQGFRTFLGSSDPRVREANVLFLPTLTPKRSDFFASDVIFLDDMPRAAINDRFCEMLKEYVGNLGGGLVVIAGPRFGPRELHQTPLADMLPVIVDPSAELRTSPKYPEFRPQITPHAARYPFMQLGTSEAENLKAWDNLGELPWYQPVSALHGQAFALAEHPTDKCADGKTPQPLIAARQYGKGEVIYLGMNETWRLRKRYGEKYYRQFWSQLIYQLGMSHALGSDKRFVARLDQQQYRAEDKVTLTVEAYDENYEPLTDETLPLRGLEGELTIPAPSGDETRTINVPMLRDGVFEVRIPVLATGEYSLRVKDPVTGKFDEQRFEVTPLSAERRRAVRDEKIQNELARQTGGKSYDLTTVSNLPADLDGKPIVEKLTRNHSLWSTPLWLTLVVGLMLGEWLSRKMIKLT